MRLLFQKTSLYIIAFLQCSHYFKQVWNFWYVYLAYLSEGADYAGKQAI